MSGPYDSYNQYNQYPQQGYQQQGYPQQGYPQQQQGGYPQQQYDPYQDPNQSFGPPRRADSFGPPQHGGFQHGQAGQSFGAYDASNPQGHSGYYQNSQPHYGGNDAFAQNQAYQNSMNKPHQQNAQYHAAIENHQFAAQSSDPNAPNYNTSAPPMSESERGLLGALGGGVGGHFLGKKAGHGFLGTVGGAILGSLTEDFAKDKKKHHGQHGKHSSHGGSSHGSSWGGSGYGRY